jgi:16S rRNA (guanine(966)-N(2))-methyltransferase RsmD
MRIIAGTAGSTLLAMPKGPAIRPTPDKVKQAIFSSLGEAIIGARVLDLFAGTGALGLEAVSRGASQAWLVDDSRFAVDAAAANAGKTRLTEKVEVERSDAVRAIERLAQKARAFDIIFADPPYEKNQRPEKSLAQKLLNCPATISILAPNGVLVMEHYKGDTLEGGASWELGRQLRHGDTLISFFKVNR